MANPKKIHYFWMGKNIPEDDLRKIITIKYENPGYKVYIWGESNIQSLITKTLDSIKFKFNGKNFDIGIINPNIEYRNIQDAFIFLCNNPQPTYKSLTVQNHKILETDENSLSNYHEKTQYLQYIYSLFSRGVYHNYAVASDIARLVILYMEGGLYLDVDVDLTNTDIKYKETEIFNRYVDEQPFADEHKGSRLEKIRSLIEKPCFDQLNHRLDKKIVDIRKPRFDKLDPPSEDIGIGDINGRNWTEIQPADRKWNHVNLEKLNQRKHVIECRKSAILHNRLGNAIISAPPKSRAVLTLLIDMASSIKKHHLQLQINQSSKKHEINFITSFNERVKQALEYHEQGMINIDINCSLPDPVWRTGLNESQPLRNTERHRSYNRLNATLSLTGPGFYADELGFRASGTIPERMKLASKDKYDLVFKKVDASAKWARINKK
ncbi:hypothetical protein Xbed_01355 [Xenorhabdus beddingii]|uniref:Subversion of eukaryotic traffic protein A n=1 Tax=Xenorhabdus beddingii TaxID=40578 RepID=A0A1Y2SQL8_9GAMM|nr:TcdA/TcdB catalytic glycosyltransferase domain-containing protein [Xenorhabdus beddingii]OTA20551.1 hypothetical protein Xbed_01355 [Xenorhabdus beddingii]